MGPDARPGRMPPLARAARAHLHMEAAAGSPLSREEATERSHAASRIVTRRDVLKLGGAAAAGVGLATAPLAGRALAAGSPEVVVVGAGLGGLTAAYRLAQAGVRVRLYEAQDRVGGRCWTARGFADGQHAEHGGEFIDTRHVHLRQLVRELGLELEDLWAGWEGGTSPNFFDDEILRRPDLEEALDPITTAVTRAARRIGVIQQGRPPSDRAYSHGTATHAAIALDQLSMADWLEAEFPGALDSQVGGWLNAVMQSWYGLGLQRLSALSLIDFFVIPYPGGDERYHVLGGNDLVVRRLRHRLGPIVRLDRPLEAIVRRSNGSLDLTFGGRHLPVRADLVVLALPFTALREVDLSRARLRDGTVRGINHLGMGTNAKVLLQYTSRFHEMTTVNDAPFSSVLLRDHPTLGTWESSTNQDGDSGLLTVYSGGRTGATLWASAVPHGPGTEPLVGDTVDQIDEVVPGSADRFNGHAWVDWWTGDPWVRGSYAAFLPGQVTRFWHNVGPADGSVHFAGEHTSNYSQGFLNGGVESGNRAAIEIMRRLGLPVPRRIGSLPYSTFS